MSRPMSFEEIAIELGISSSRVRQIYDRAIRKLARNEYRLLCEMRQITLELSRNNQRTSTATPRKATCK